MNLFSNTANEEDLSNNQYELILDRLNHSISRKDFSPDWKLVRLVRSKWNTITN